MRGQAGSGAGAGGTPGYCREPDRGGGARLTAERPWKDSRWEGTRNPGPQPGQAVRAGRTLPPLLSPAMGLATLLPGESPADNFLFVFSSFLFCFVFTPTLLFFPMCLRWFLLTPVREACMHSRALGLRQEEGLPSPHHLLPSHLYCHSRTSLGN